MENEDKTNPPTDDNRPWETIRRALRSGEIGQVQSLLVELPLSDALRSVLHLTETERALVLSVIDANVAADIIEEAPSEQAAEMVAELETTTIVEILDELDSDVQVDVLSELRQENANTILGQMDPNVAEDLRRLSEFASDCAGGLMTSDTFSFGSAETVGAVLKQIIESEEDFQRYRGQSPYVLDEDNRLLGVVSLRNLLTVPRQTLLTEILTSAISVSPEANLTDLEDLMNKYKFLGLPVIGDAGQLIGSISRSSIADAVLERLETDNLRSHGVVGDELRSFPLFVRARRRLSWLSVNIMLNILAASVIAFYTDTLAAVIAIAVFLPMVSDMSGCSGNQAVAVSMRELALGHTKPIDVYDVWLKEISVGIINGFALGILIALVAWFWMGNPFLGLVIGLALAINTMISVSLGGIIPLLLKRFRIDPAVASGPLLTTATDIVGFFLVLSLATLFLPLLK